MDKEDLKLNKIILKTYYKEKWDKLIFIKIQEDINKEQIQFQWKIELVMILNKNHFNQD